MENNQFDTSIILDAETGIQRLGGNKAGFFRILNVFCNKTEELLQGAKIAIEKKDYATAKELIHSLKGSSISASANKMHGIAQDIDTKIKQQDYSTLVEDFNTLEAAYYEVHKTIQELENQ